MSRVRLALGCLPFVLGACGFDALVFTPRGFDPTPTPRARLVGSAPAQADLQVFDATNQVVGEGAADANGAFDIELIEGAGLVSLRVASAAGLSTFVPQAGTDGVVDTGALDPTSTARSLLLAHEVVGEAGSTFEATPPSAARGLWQTLQGDDLADLVAATQAILQSESVGFDHLGLVEDFATSQTELAQAWTTARDAAAQQYQLQVRCDPSRLATLFTVDMSGRGRDGNGRPQLIRQPSAEDRVFIGFTSDESSQVLDPSIPTQLTPNDVRFAMTDDGRGGDEVAADGVFSVVVPLPRGARILYKYTNGAAGQGFTGSEEWPGNARIIEVQDVLTGRPDGEADCLVIRRDAFGDEASNKNFVNTNGIARARGGSVSFDADLGGQEAPRSAAGLWLGGLELGALRQGPGLTPTGVAEARENGVCSRCPAPLVLDPDDVSPPELLSAERISTQQIRVRLSEPLEASTGERTDRWLVLDADGRAVPVNDVRLSGSEATLSVTSILPRGSARLRVRDLVDASAAGNVLDMAEVEIAPDTTPPRLLSVRASSVVEIDSEARPEDPTVGRIVELVFDERPEASAAADPARYRIEGLTVNAAELINDSNRVRLFTDVQQKGRPYDIEVVGLRDPAGNAADQNAAFKGFALYEVRFPVVVDFAFASSDGTERGLPRGEQLFLTGTPLAAARALDGRSLSITDQGFTRTDVTGWPQFELTPMGENFEGVQVYETTVLLPPGTWSWKAAHGIAGEYTRAPTTLEKVYKTLVTSNDSTGVRVNPRTLVADNSIDYGGASLSEGGDEPARQNVLFKREAPDEVCEVFGNVSCPLIVVGTWRDLVLDPGGRTRDYDDGVLPLPPHRPSLPDVQAPQLLGAAARDSFSILLSFDERLRRADELAVSLVDAETGFGRRVRVVASNELLPHQVVVMVDGSDCASALTPGRVFTLSYRGARDDGDRVDLTERQQTVLAPDRCSDLTPLTDETPPSIVEVEATDLTEVTVRFSEPLDPATVMDTSFSITSEGAPPAPLSIEAATLSVDKTEVRLDTAAQSILTPYVLTATGLADASPRGNVSTATSARFIGFGDSDPAVLLRARSIGDGRVIAVFDEPVRASSALNPSNYTIAGATVTDVAFSADPGRRSDAFDAERAPTIATAVMLSTTGLPDGAPATLSVDGVLDRSGNSSVTTADFVVSTESPTVEVILEIELSDRRRVAGAVPSRAISSAELAGSREGVFALGARADPSHVPVAGDAGPVNEVLGGFGVEGQPLDGIEARLRDDGAGADRAAGDGVFSLSIPGVPLGTTIIWKAFAPFTVPYRDANPQDSAAAFADGLPGPSAFADGQEFPGNENGVIVLDDGGDGQVRLRALFGDEITYKKNTGGPAYLWLVDDLSPQD